MSKLFDNYDTVFASFKKLFPSKKGNKSLITMVSILCLYNMMCTMGNLRKGPITDTIDKGPYQHVHQILQITVFTICIRTDRPEQTV